MPEGISISDQEWERRIRRRSVMLAIAAWITLGCGIVSVAYVTIQVVADFFGEDSWPSGLFLAVLILYLLKTLLKYSNQRRDYYVEWD